MQLPRCFLRNSGRQIRVLTLEPTGRPRLLNRLVARLVCESTGLSICRRTTFPRRPPAVSDLPPPPPPSRLISRYARDDRRSRRFPKQNEFALSLDDIDRFSFKEVDSSGCSEGTQEGRGKIAHFSLFRFFLFFFFSFFRVERSSKIGRQTERGATTRENRESRGKFQSRRLNDCHARQHRVSNDARSCIL